nr:formate dehydrogenase accessory sulfurtransferase FdhD [Bacilli bacterium]
MSLAITKQQTIVQYTKLTGAMDKHDVIATEYALTIYLGEREMATIVCTPNHVEEMVVGFLASEGIIRSFDEITALKILPYRGAVHVTTSTAHTFSQNQFQKRYIASCCGRSRQSFYFYNDATTAKRVDDPVTIDANQVFALMTSLEEEAALFHETGGVHSAKLCDSYGVGTVRTDIGRHNALDKLYGYSLMQKMDVQGKVIVFSGRLSSEVLLKVAKIGVGIVIAKSAPTALALTIAQELHITTIGFVKEQTFNVYTYPNRIIMTADEARSEIACTYPSMDKK